MPLRMQVPPGARWRSSASVSRARKAPVRLATSTVALADGPGDEVRMSAVSKVVRVTAGFRARLRRADSTASGSWSTPVTRAAPSRSAAIARMPEPQPTSSTVAPSRSSVCSAARHSRVVAWWPVPKPMEGSITRQIGASGLRGADVVRAGSTSTRPTLTGSSPSCDLLAQSSSGSFAVDTSRPSSANAAVSAPAARSRASASTK